MWPTLYNNFGSKHTTITFVAHISFFSAQTITIAITTYFHFLVINNSPNCLNETYKVSNDAEKHDTHVKKRKVLWADFCGKYALKTNVDSVESLIQGYSNV